LDVPDAEGVPLGAQSGPQPELDDVVVVVELDTAAPPLPDEELVVVELGVGWLAVTVAVLVCVAAVVVDEVDAVEVSEPVPVPVAVVCPPPELPPQPAATRTTTSAATIRDTKRIASSSVLLQALARFAHERDGLGEDNGHDRAQLLGLLLGRPLDVDAIDCGHRQIDGQLDRVIGPRETLSALHLLGELSEPALQVVGISEQAAESTSFHTPHGSRLAAGGIRRGKPGVDRRARVPALRGIRRGLSGHRRATRFPDQPRLPAGEVAAAAGHGPLA
jgi:hypothetical protein